MIVLERAVRTTPDPSSRSSSSVPSSANVVLVGEVGEIEVVCVHRVLRVVGGTGGGLDCEMRRGEKKKGEGKISRLKGGEEKMKMSVRGRDRERERHLQQQP